MQVAAVPSSAEQCLRVKYEGFSIVLYILQVPTACWVGGNTAALLVYRITLRAPQARMRQNWGKPAGPHWVLFGFDSGEPIPRERPVLSVGKDQ